MTEDLYKLLSQVERGLDDWIVQYASEFCDPEKVQEVWKRITENGGTLGYVTDLREKVSAYIKSKG